MKVERKEYCQDCGEFVGLTWWWRDEGEALMGFAECPECGRDFWEVTSGPLEEWAY